MSGLLDGKVASVTGSGHGIGRGHALELAKHGATVIVIEDRGGKAISDFSDVGDVGIDVFGTRASSLRMGG
jgi:NAD(P)-dependent dehydrogenase (short-subunit alcohol dehydrogenase family)